MWISDRRASRNSVFGMNEKPRSQQKRHSRQANRRRRSLCCEILESRLLLAGDVLVRFEFTDLAEKPLDLVEVGENWVPAVGVGEDFLLRVHIRDSRPLSEAQGVRKAYFDVSYDAALGMLDGSIQFGPEYSFSTSALPGPGLISEVGGRDEDLEPPEPLTKELLLCTIPFEAQSAGTFTISASLPASPQKQVQYFDTILPVPIHDIEFEGGQLEIRAGGIHVSPTSGLVTTESGDQVTFEMVLTKQPAASVTVGLASSDPTEGTVWPASVTFTAANWNIPQTVTVTGVNDNVLDGDVAYTIITAPASSDDVSFRGLDSEDVSVINRDNDSVLAITLADANKFEGNSGNTPFTFTVTRSGYTGGATTVNWAVTGSGANPANAADFGGALPASQITFATGETSKTLTVNVSGDTVFESNEGFTVTLSGASGGATISTAAASGTIRNDDPTLSIGPLDAQKLEGNSGSTPFLFTVTRSGYTGGTTTVNWAVTGSGADPATAADFAGTLPSGQISFAPGETSKTLTVNVSGDALPEEDEGFTVTLSSNSGAQITMGPANGTIRNDDQPTFVVTGLSPLGSGFVASFNASFNASLLNLYDNVAGDLGPADVTVTGASVGPVRGSLVVRADQRQLTFIKTGGPLEPDSYTVALRSAADGFSDSTGSLLDGDANGIAGGDYTGSFVVAARPANEVTVSLPDFVRGFGQTVKLPSETTAGIPVTLSTGQNVTAVDLDLVFDPALLTVTSFANSVDGATSAFQLVAPGRMRVTVSSASPFRSTPGTVELGRFIASVPATAPYAAKQMLRLENLNVEDLVPQPRPARPDHGLHLAALVGDGNASRTYTGGDATLQQRLIVGQGSGFSAYPLVDPLLIADVNRSETLTGGDATLLQRMIVGTPISQAPPPPTGITPPAITGLDPRLFIPNDLTGRPGDTVTIPVMVDVTEPAGVSIAAIDLAIAYDPAVFTAANFVRGPLLDGFGFTAPIVNTATPGILRVTMSTAAGPDLAFGTSGVVFQFDATIAAEAAEGVSRINLLQNYESTSTGIEDNNIDPLTLVPAPTNADNDPVDGLLTVAPLMAELSISATDAAKAEGQTGSSAFTFTVTRTGSSSGTASVQYTVTGTGANSADAADFGGTLPSGQVTFAAGETSRTVTISVPGDATVEADEQFSVTLSGASTPTQIATATAVGTILNDDAAVISISGPPPTDEGDAGTTLVEFTVRLSAPVDVPVQVDFATVDSTAEDENGDLDYHAASGTLTFLPNRGLTHTLAVAIVGDTSLEQDETFQVLLRNLDTGTPARNVSLGNATATATIIDDDAARLTIAVTQHAEEDVRHGSFTITTDRLLGEPLEIQLEVSGTAAANEDYVTIGTTLLLPADTASVTVPVTVLPDAWIEGDETVVVRIVGTSNAAARPGTPDTATLTIVDEDATTVSIVAGDDPATEPASNGQFLVRLGRGKVAPPQGLAVTYAVSGTATAGEDYQPLTDTVLIPAGQTEAVIPIVVLDDELVEPAETVVVQLLATNNPGATNDPDSSTAAVSISDDDTASVSITVVNDGTEAATPAAGRLRVTQTRASATDTVIRYTVSGTATPGEGEDYLPLGGTVTIAAGTTTADVVLSVLDDELVEGTETVTITLDAITDSLPAITLHPEQQAATVDILDDDEAMVAIVKLADGAETDPPTPGRFRVTQTKPAAGDTVLTYTLDGTATPGPGNDYLPLSGTVTIAAGQTSADIDVTVLNDSLIESEETVIITLDEIIDADAGVTIDQANRTATAIIADDLTEVSIAADGENTSEPGPGDGHWTVTLGGGKLAPPGGIQVQYSIGGSAAPGTDYAVLPGVVTIPSGESSARIPLTVLDDEIVELPETAVITLSATDFASVLIDANHNQAALTIEDDDATTVFLAASDAIGSESGDNHGEFLLTLAGDKLAPPEGITVSYAVAGTAVVGEDYTPLIGSVMIPDGQSSAVIAVLVLDDAIVELDETVEITLIGTNHPGATVDLSADAATVTLQDDDPTTVSITASIPDAAEPDDDGQFTVSLDNGKLAPAGGLVVSYTIAGTATAGTDYTALSGSVTIPAGAASATIPVVVRDDDALEHSETVVVTLSGTDHPRVSLAATDTSATVTIADDDSVTVLILASSPNAAEPDVPGQFTVTLDQGGVAPAGGLVVRYTTTGTATAGADYTAAENSLVIPAGASSATISVAVLDDQIVERDETVIVRLTETDHPGATIAPAMDTATVTIADNDPTTVSIIASVPNAAEPDSNGQVTVRLDNDKVAPIGGLVISYTTAGTATAGADYTSLPGSVTIPAGASSATIAVAVLDDEIVEVDETVTLTLSGTNHPGATIHASENLATVTIDSADDDTTVSMQASDAIAREQGTDAGQFTVTLDGGKVAPVGGIVVSYTTGGTAAPGADFTALAGTVTIPAGASSATIPVAVQDDNVIEMDETVIVTLTGTNYPGAAIAQANHTATVTIEDNDQTTVSVVASDPNAGEPNAHGEFTVRLDNNKLAPAGGIIVEYTVGGTATLGSDYTALSGTVTIPAGQGSATLPVTVIADTTPDELAETVVVTLVSANHAGVSLDATNQSATVTIAEDDPRNASISGVVWADANDDGQQQNDGNGNPQESGIPGVIVQLTGTARNGSQLNLQAMTDDDGRYRFIDLPAGTYEVREEQPAAWSDGREALAASTLNDTYSNITVTPSQQIEDYSFGERGLRPEFISKRLFLASTPPSEVYFRELNALAMQRAGDPVTARAIRNADIPSVVSAQTASSDAAAGQQAAPLATSNAAPASAVAVPAEGELNPAPPAASTSHPAPVVASVRSVTRIPGGEGETAATRPTSPQVSAASGVNTVRPGAISRGESSGKQAFLPHAATGNPLDTASVVDLAFAEEAFAEDHWRDVPRASSDTCDLSWPMHVDQTIQRDARPRTGPALAIPRLDLEDVLETILDAEIESLGPEAGGVELE